MKKMVKNNDLKISKKTFIIDMLINIFSATIPIITLNVFVNPLLAKNISIDEYGTMSTCIGLVNLVNGIWGSSVSYSRLLDKTEGLIKNNYSVVLGLNLVLAVISNYALLWITGCLTADINVGLLSLCVILIIINNYLIVEYRLVLSYNKILISNIFCGIGYLVGFLLIYITGFSRWEWVFVFGYGFAVIYNLLSTTIWKGELIIDNNFKSIIKETEVFIITAFLSGISSYLDKLVIYPVLGAPTMAYYQTASIVAKVIPLFSSAISNVILSYLVKIENMSKKNYYLYVSILALISVVGLMVCNVFVPIVIQFLYPLIYEGSVIIVPYTNLIAILGMFYSFVFPLTLKFAKRNKQYDIQLGRIVPYIILTLVLVRYYGIFGFCYATIISQILQIIIVLFILHKIIKTEEVNEQCSID